MRGARRIAVAAFALAIAVSNAPGRASAGRDRAPRAFKALHPALTPTASTAPYLHSSLTPGGVITKPKVYLVFWGKQWATDPAHARNALTAFFTHLYGSADTWGMLLDQYCQGLPARTVKCGASGQHVTHPTTSPVGGAWLDSGANAPATATQSQLAAEAARAATHFGNGTPAKNANSIYFIASPHGTHPDRFPNSSFCAWHSVVKNSAGMIPYVNLPYVPDLGAGSCTTLQPATTLDGYFSSATHEYAEAVTDPWLSRGWYDGQGNEIADLCVDLDRRETLAGARYDVQGLWSNQTMSCRTS